jgi:hypothetical protein
MMLPTRCSIAAMATSYGTGFGSIIHSGIGVSLPFQRLYTAKILANNQIRAKIQPMRISRGYLS